MVRLSALLLLCLITCCCSFAADTAATGPYRLGPTDVLKVTVTKHDDVSGQIVVAPDGSIRLRVNPEVSALDYANAVKISGYTIPAISTRKADTEIELKNGQSFAISGLLDNRITDSLSRIPGISNIPVLGQLFRSKDLKHSVTELIVIVTATVVDPLNAPAPAPPVTPKWPVPFLSPPDFDTGLASPDNLMGQKPVADGKQ